MMLRVCAGNGSGFRCLTLRLILTVAAVAFLLTVLQFGFSRRRVTSRRSKESTFNRQIVLQPDHNLMSIDASPNGTSGSFFNSSDGLLSYQQNQRQQLLAQLCPQFLPERPLKSSDWSELLVDDDRKYIYCKVEKVACTSWKRALLELTGQFQNAEKLNFYRVHSRYVRDNVLRPLNKYKPAEIDFRLRTYFKFLFTRHPFERLVSAYRSKIKRDKEYKGLKSRIKRRKKRRKGSRVGEFSAFIRFVLDKAARGRELDVHWRPQYDICRPCSIPYDFIGRYETLYSDADFVLGRLQATPSKPEIENSTSSSNRNTTITTLGGKLVKFPRSDPDNKRTNSMYLVRKMMSELSPADLERLKKLYDRDFRLYGYQP